MTTAEEYMKIANQLYSVHALPRSKGRHRGDSSMRGRLGARTYRVVGVLAASAVMVMAFTGCSMRGDDVGEKMKHEGNLALQREAALEFREEWQPDVESIRFTNEGLRPGFGSAWGANAVATIGGREYQVIIGPGLGPGFPTGDGPPEAVVANATPLKIIFSDGTSEVIR